MMRRALRHILLALTLAPVAVSSAACFDALGNIDPTPLNAAALT